jgi:hypothetical protein
MNTDFKTLVSKDSKGKIRVVEISYEGNEATRIYTIYRYTGQFEGKMTKQPEIIVDRGKATRNIHEQVELQFNALVKGYKDKGYIELENEIDNYSSEELYKLFGDAPAGTNGVVKPMLAKQADKVTKTDIFNKKWIASRKIDGLRCIIYLGDDGKLHTSSRGATNYDSAMFEILTHPALIKLFKNNEGLMLDGECYHHGYTLQQINSIARTQKVAKDLEILQFYWYDIVDLNNPFKARLTKMKSIAAELKEYGSEIGWEPDRMFKENELRIQFVPQVEVSGWDNMMKLHNEYVSEGWEGLVIRDPERPYKPNGRTNDMIKIKVYKDDCFKVIGKEAGLRGSEDMVFIMQMPDGRTFKAKPFGDREQKQEYWINFEEKYNGHIGECKFFYYSDDGIPLQPAFKAFRDDL